MVHLVIKIYIEEAGKVLYKSLLKDQHILKQHKSVNFMTVIPVTTCSDIIMILFKTQSSGTSQNISNCFISTERLN